MFLISLYEKNYTYIDDSDCNANENDIDNVIHNYSWSTWIINIKTAETYVNTTGPTAVAGAFHVNIIGVAFIVLAECVIASSGLSHDIVT